MDISQLIAMAGGSAGVAAMAQRFGLPQAQVEQVLGQLGQGATRGVSDPGALTEQTSAATGVEPGAVQDMLGQLMNPGVGSGGLMQMLDRNNDGSAVDDVIGLAKGFLGR